jgi:hypothetical protein
MLFGLTMLGSLEVACAVFDDSSIVVCGYGGVLRRSLPTTIRRGKQDGFFIDSDRQTGLPEQPSGAMLEGLTAEEWRIPRVLDRQTTGDRRDRGRSWFHFPALSGGSSPCVGSTSPEVAGQ